MSNNLVSEQLSILNRQMVQMESVSDKLDSSLSNMQMGMMRPVSSNPALHQFGLSSQQMGLVEPMSSNFGSQSFTVSNKQMGQMEPNVSNPVSRQFLMPNQQLGEMEAMLNNIGSQNLILPSKRKAVVEPVFNFSVPQQSSIPNKRVTQMEPFPNSPGLSLLSPSNKKTVQMQYMSSNPGLQNLPAPNKRMVRNDSISSKSGSQRVQTPKNRTAQMETSPKVQTESFGAVRSKMRESLAAALALACQHQDKALYEGKNSQSETAITPRQTREDSQPTESTSASADTAQHVPENTMDTLPSKESCSADKPHDCQSTSVETSANESMGSSVQTWKCYGQEFQYNPVLPDEDVSFSDNLFVKDDLLQGNGLSWAMDLDMEMAGRKEIQTAKKPNLVHEDVGGDGGQQAVCSPQNLAFEIEAELFKLFGGVNKKYKEKGRSLLFNLKDRSNPELVERVMSGEISPERLCSMTAEELASKELSQWRLAKAEELAQMVVLPDLDVDMRRLVKKTHKGEYQVEVEQDDGVSVEVSVGTTSFTQLRPKNKETEVHTAHEADEIKDRDNVVGEKNILENQDLSLTIPNDGTDLMQGLMVDELKDAEFLPPIVSLDEFMESLNSEPPFENLPVDAGQTMPLADKENSETVNKLMASDIASKDPVDGTLDKADKVIVKDTELDVNLKSSESRVERKTSPPGIASTAELVWEGVLQLSISALVTVIGFFRSGEKTSTKEWPGSLEIKGRVRLDAFEKFLQELPMSRSRAVMVVHFVLKEGSSENEHASLCEVVDSYVMDERLGFAEPAPGVELYLCPPHKRIVELLSKHLSEDHTEILNSTDNGLIGVVVWRKAHLSSTVSPNSFSHHKHSSKKQQFTSRRQQEKDANVNVNATSKVPVSFGLPPTKLEPPADDDDDDDIPPGFGPAATRDEDDLPEFNFSGNLNPSVTNLSSQNPTRGSRLTPFNPSSQSSAHPVDQMRELVHKYGKTGAGASPRHWQDKRGVGMGIQPWNDDDDDIPEWQPQAPQQQLQPHPSMHGFQHPMQPHVMVNKHLGSGAPRQAVVQLGSPVVMPLQPQTNIMTGPQNVAPSWQQGARSGPHGLHYSSIGSQPNSGQYYGVPLQPGMPWRQDAPRSRGF